jgi:hypothetical protein
MKLTEIADTLKAGIETVNVTTFLRNVTLPTNFREFTYKNRPYKLIFTLDILPNNKSFRHLSIGVLDGQPLDNEVIDEIVGEFFTKYFEIPSLVHSSKFVKHYLERV